MAAILECFAPISSAEVRGGPPRPALADQDRSAASALDPPRMRRFALPLPFLAVVLINAGDGVANTLVPLYLDARGYAVEAIGLIVAIYGITSLLSRLPSGMLYRRRR